MQKIKIIDVKDYPNELTFDTNKDYVGYVNEDAAYAQMKDAIAFSVSNLSLEADGLYGNFQMINGKATELLNFIGSFEIKTVFQSVIESDTNELLSLTVDSFVAIPDIILT